MERPRHVENHPRDAGAHQAGIKFAPHAYDYDPDADRIGLQAAGRSASSRDAC
jgi:hypothetical protein